MSRGGPEMGGRPPRGWGAGERQGGLVRWWPGDAQGQSNQGRTSSDHVPSSGFQSARSGQANHRPGDARPPGYRPRGLDTERVPTSARKSSTPEGKTVPGRGVHGCWGVGGRSRRPPASGSPKRSCLLPRSPHTLFSLWCLRVQMPPLDKSHWIGGHPHDFTSSSALLGFYLMPGAHTRTLRLGDSEGTEGWTRDPRLGLSCGDGPVPSRCPASCVSPNASSRAEGRAGGRPGPITQRSSAAVVGRSRRTQKPLSQSRRGDLSGRGGHSLGEIVFPTAEWKRELQLQPELRRGPARYRMTAVCHLSRLWLAEDLQGQISSPSARPGLQAPSSLS